MQMNMGLLLSKRAHLNPDREAYVESDGSRRFTFKALNERANRLANSLQADGIKPGDRVGLLLMNSVEFMEAFFAIAKVGGVVVPLNWRLVADELEFILKDAGATRLIFDDAFSSTATELHRRANKTDIQQWLQVLDGTSDDAAQSFATSYEQFCGASGTHEPHCGAEDDDMLYIMYTSGTTGLPKGVVHTHTTAMWGVLTIHATADYQANERYLACLPMFHVGALTPLTINVYHGATTYVMRSFDPVAAWECVAREKITSGLLVPAMLNFMVQVPGYENYDWSSVRGFMTGAAPVPLALTQQFQHMGIDINQVYGLTETCGPACLMDSLNAVSKPESCGKPFFFTEVMVADEYGNEVPVGEAGEMLVRGKHIMREYWNRPDATADTLVNGWLRTGDVGVMDDQGFFSIQDRIKDMIISGGENVYPAEIEGVLQSHPGISEAGVIGQRSEKWGESPLAVVVKTDDALTAEEILSYCQDKLARFKQPTAVEFIDVIPRNPSGKILKRVLREQYPSDANV